MSFSFYKQSKKAKHAVIVWEYGEEMEVVFVLGGDGTVHEFVNGLSPLWRRPLFGNLPGGTSNDFSRTLKIPQNVRQAAQALVNGKVRSN
ncbi:diacylglycerol kinase family protein [Peribacillus frigoritolerans]|nr:diacylglycerol kinase family protein [Peribacillus frigoritolerans]